jgi:hypothetical protein
MNWISLIALLITAVLGYWGIEQWGEARMLRKLEATEHYSPPMLINMMKCSKHGWFHGGMNGWVCPKCKKDSQFKEKDE